MESAKEKNMVQVQQNEIDLMDLFKVFYKNRVMITLIIVMVTVTSLGLALYVRSNTENIVAINFKKSNRIDSFYAKKANLRVSETEIENLFKQDDVVEEMYALPSLKKIFQENGAVDTLDGRRKFLEKTIKLKAVMENGKLKHYQLSMVEVNKDLDEKKILDAYLNILNKKLYTSYTSRINEKYKVIKQKKEGYEETLTTIENEINKVISQEPRELFENEKAWDIIQVKHFKLFESQKKIKELYTKYGDELVGIEGLKGDIDLRGRVEKVSSFYEIEQKSKAKLILIIGMVMGVLFGGMGAFIREFLIYFKKEIKVNN